MSAAVADPRGAAQAAVQEIRRDIEGHGEFLIRYLTEHGRVSQDDAQDV